MIQAQLLWNSKQSTPIGIKSSTFYISPEALVAQDSRRRWYIIHVQGELFR